MIRKLGAADLAAYRAVWLHGLTHAPQNFLFTVAEALCVTDAALVSGLEAGHHWGAFDGDRLVGVATLRRGGPERMRHMADLGPIYVLPEARRRGNARALIRSVLDAARARGVLQVELCVDARNAGARALYETMGFVAFGLRPRSVIVDGAARDDVLMLCKLD